MTVDTEASSISREPKSVLRRGVENLVVLGVGLVVALGLAEGTLRVYSVIKPTFVLRGLDPMGVLIEPHGQFGFRQRPNAVYHYKNGTTATTNSLGFRGPEVPTQPAPGVTRITIFGGSASYGWSVGDDQTIDAHLRRILASRYPDRHFEVVNLAYDGYDSYQDLQRLKSDGLRMKPSIVILNTGLNDVRNAWYPHLKDADPRTLIWEPVLQRLRDEQTRGGPTVRTRIKHYLMVARLPAFFKDQIGIRREAMQRATDATARKSGTPASAAPSAPQPTSTDHPPYSDAADYFERNVQQMVDSSTRVGAAVLLSTPPSSIRSYPPDATSTQTYWIYNAKVTGDYRDTLSDRLRRMASAEEKQGRSVRFVAAQIPVTGFVDDAHLNSEGNRRLAEAFADAIRAWIEPATPSPKAR